MIENLQEIGLTKNEAKIYLCLLKLGKQKASQIISNTNVSSSKIYELMDSMEKKGFVQKIPENVSYYVAKSFKNIEEIIENKQQTLEELKNKIKNYKKLNQKRTGEEVIVLRGANNFANILKDLPPLNNFHYAIKHNSDMNPNWRKSVKMNLKKNIKYKVLYNTNSPKKNIEEWSKLIPNYKFIKTDKVNIIIESDLVMISDANIETSILIKSPQVAYVMKQLFDGYYQSQK